MKTIPLAALVLAALSAWAMAADAPAPAGNPESGIDKRYVDPAVRPQDDFYQYVNGKWLATKQIPADKGSYNAFNELRDTVEEQLRPLVDDLPHYLPAGDPDLQKITDLYASFLDEASLQPKGYAPLAGELARIDALSGPGDLAALIAHFNRVGISAPLGVAVHLDAKDTTHYVFDIGQDGLGLPDRDYYLKDDAKLAQIRTRYVAHVQKTLELAGSTQAAQQAADVMALETELARLQWTKVENRNPVKTYNKFLLPKLAELAPGYDWHAFLDGTGVGGRIDFLTVRQPSYVTGVAGLLQKTPLPVWQAYFRWRLLSEMSPFLSKDFDEEHFAFYSKALRDIPQMRPRWKRALGLVEVSMGEALGRAYVARYFPPQSKVRMEQLVQTLLQAYKEDLNHLAWMGPQTRQRAQAKLARFTVKIGYPAKWRDYGALRIERSDLVGNVLRAQAFEYDRNLAKLGQPIDRAEWDMSPQTVNAYYNPELNEIVFPAAILQPPFFNAQADDAVNYGAIGAVIGHEISHGFDDEGSQYDGDGKVLDPPGWFTQEDLDRFKTHTHALVEQYAAYSTVPGYPINGELTLGENIADNSGLSIAYQAYHLSLAGKTPPVIDGWTADQRFFMGWAQIYRNKMRENEAILRIKSDPHSPGQIRGTVPERNLAGFYSAFDIKPGDRMYLAPEKRVTIW